eukprot:scaffold1811_cov411-Prasinococcus_capsulatus_cf.AAC.8
MGLAPGAGWPSPVEEAHKNWSCKFLLASSGVDRCVKAIQVPRAERSATMRPSQPILWLPWRRSRVAPRIVEEGELRRADRLRACEP